MRGLLAIHPSAVRIGDFDPNRGALRGGDCCHYRVGGYLIPLEPLRARFLLHQVKLSSIGTDIKPNLRKDDRFTAKYGYARSDRSHSGDLNLWVR